MLNGKINSKAIESELFRLAAKYPFINLFEIGTSRMGKPIYSAIIGEGKKSVMINASHHANEWITSAILMQFIEEYAQSYDETWAEKVTLHCIPLVNPDGVDLVTGYIGELKISHADAKKMTNAHPIKENQPFPKCWKANIIGVDLNSNYQAEWELAKDYKFSKGYTQPGPRDYVGEFPLSEPETCAMVAYTIVCDFDLTLSLHTQGEVIYWRYMDYNPPGAEELAQRLSKASGYELEDVPDYSSHGGYRDWFISNFNRPGFTIECGFGESPLPFRDFAEIYKKVAPLLWEALESV